MEIQIGSIMYFPYKSDPKGWLPCKGQIVQLIQYELLYSLIGTKYGGDGYASFGIPKIEPLLPSNGPAMQAYIATAGSYPTFE